MFESTPINISMTSPVFAPSYSRGGLFQNVHTCRFCALAKGPGGLAEGEASRHAGSPACGTVACGSWLCREHDQASVPGGDLYLIRPQGNHFLSVSGETLFIPFSKPPPYRKLWRWERTPPRPFGCGGLVRSTARPSGLMREAQHSEAVVELRRT